MSRLPVEHVKQDKTETCWHAAIQMVYGYRYHGCVHPAAAQWAANAGAGGGLPGAAELGFHAEVVRKSIDAGYLNGLLEAYGPIIASIDRDGSPLAVKSHAVVITGASGNTFTFHDPGSSTPHEQGSIALLNQHIERNVPGLYWLP